MLLRTARAFVAASVAALALTGLHSGTATAAPQPQAAAARTIYYNASGAAEFRSAVDQGAAIWNSRVTTVRFVAGSPANVTIVADDGWPRAQTTSLGNGRVWMGRQATNQGYAPVRIASHELGHILGLPDRKPGPCTSLMSGSSAGVACTNPNPNAAEIAEVNANFGGGRTVLDWQREFVG
ncbi:snapalysin family zinc-dependent metalloprotease [Umezawaea beigongshangensis]|uniref:snapalysin family zinc-dependent metalloprotease n=1 Tax=Umezawaea beigongshangensis TaxID=2780383 RepID=UPI0027DB6BE3|nr:snapalysin family zinc-dependent metalloprotease [Umezawaea beigongshangensis]